MKTRKFAELQYEECAERWCDVVFDNVPLSGSVPIVLNVTV
jgi:hypothetical protein